MDEIIEKPGVQTKVISRMERDRDGISYEVYVDDYDGYDGEHGRGPLWETYIAFGASDRNSAGGPAFKAAAREQDAIAEQVAELCIPGRTDDEVYELWTARKKG